MYYLAWRNIRKEVNEMLTFLYETVAMIAEAGDLELTSEQMKTIVENLMQNEELWDIVDGYVIDEIKNILKGE